MRKKEWLKELLIVFELYKNRPFKYGTTDCFLFSADCCKAICGVDFMENYRGTYKSKKKATNILKEIDFVTEMDKIFTQKPLSLLQRGDMVAYKNDSADDITLAIYFNGYWAVTKDGLRRIDITPLYVWGVM